MAELTYGYILEPKFYIFKYVKGLYLMCDYICKRLRTKIKYLFW